MKFLLLILLVITASGCSARKAQNAEAWANVWHIAHALELGLQPAAATPSLKKLATKGAELNGYTIDEVSDGSDEAD